MNRLDTINNKILTPDTLKNQLAVWRFKDKKIVFTNGCFDLLHLGHIDYLSKAKDSGDVLLIGVNTDDSVRRLKGESRPLTDQKSRAIILASLGFVDGVTLFDEDTPYELINIVQPDVLVKGSDYNAEEVVGYDIVKAKGGKVITIDFLEGYSTTAIANKIKKG